jgi:threonine/homoserine/homoserine lactone efflux protein
VETVPIPLAFIATSFIIELTPGPNMGYLALLSVREGRRAGFAATLGVAFGLSIIGLAAALGLMALVSSSRWLYEALRWGGALYLLWLAWEGWRGEEETSAGRPGPQVHSQFFIRGLITNLLNPKAGIFYVAVLPRFAEQDPPTLWQFAVLSATYVTVATLVHALVVVLAGAARPWLENENRSAIARRLLSVLLAGVAIWLLATTRYASG